MILDGMNIKAPIFERLLQISVFFTRVRTCLFKVAFYRLVLYRCVEHKYVDWKASELLKHRPLLCEL